MSDENSISQSAILIVDDNPENLQVLGGFLNKEGLAVEFALNGNSAIKWLAKKKFDLVLLDIMMPDMDGYQVCSIIRNNPAISDIPVIFITAKTDSESIVDGFEAGAVDYITKPFIHNELLARVKTHLNLRKAKQQIISQLNKLEEKSRDINNSIGYARNIQNAVLNTTTINLKKLPEYFILNSPKDILSGDFYWINNIKEQMIFAILDCTGHGVPGALMSILGITLLKETIIHENILQPDKILECLRCKLINSLGQHESTINVKDSIEGSIINYNSKSDVLSYAGTLNPIIHIHDHEITEIKADRIPIGFHEKYSDFSLKTIKITTGDLIYLFSDGYVDQFGGPDTKKIMSKRFRELLLKYHNLPLETQKIKLHDYLNSWMGDNEQTDDILVVGIRF